MAKLRQGFKPYSFRARVLLMLTISTLVASVISLAFSYTISRNTIRAELLEGETEVAAGMLALYEQASLPPDEISRMVMRENLAIIVLSGDEIGMLPDSVASSLRNVPIFTYNAQGANLPRTYVRLGENIVAIRPSQQFNVFLIALVRIAFAAVSFISVFLLMSMLSTWSIARPVTQITRATRTVADGDFKVHLPEDRTDELGQLMRAFNSMTNALDRTSWLQKDFIASISHEFRTPIASIKGFARLLQMPDLTEEQRQEYVSMIAQESDRLSRLSATLLRLSALEQQAGPASAVPFSLDEQVRQVILRMEPAWSGKEIEWQLELDEPVEICSDSELLNQVWVNLIQNAVKFSDPGGVIAVTVRPHGDGAAFVITDHGVGMDAETLSRIFDRFYQADRSRRREGVGLGLTLVKRILDLLDGSVTVQSEPGQGSTFTVLLPYAPHTVFGTKEKKHE